MRTNLLPFTDIPENIQAQQAAEIRRWRVRWQRKWEQTYIYSRHHICSWWYVPKYLCNTNTAYLTSFSQPRWLSGLTRSCVHSLWLLVDHCVLSNWDRILVRAVKGLISRAGMVSICPLLWQRDVKLQQTNKLTSFSAEASVLWGESKIIRALPWDRSDFQAWLWCIFTGICQ